MEQHGFIIRMRRAANSIHVAAPLACMGNASHGKSMRPGRLASTSLPWHSTNMRHARPNDSSLVRGGSHTEQQDGACVPEVMGVSVHQGRSKAVHEKGLAANRTQGSLHDGGADAATRRPYHTAQGLGK